MMGLERASRFKEHSVGAGGHLQDLIKSNRAYQHDSRCIARGGMIAAMHIIHLTCSTDLP